MVSFMLLVAPLLVAGAFASTVEWTAVPSGISLPSSQDASLSNSKLALLNQYLLGLTAQSPVDFDATGDLFSRPRALAVITVDSLEEVHPQAEKSFQFFSDGTSSQSVEKKLSVVFGSDRETVTITQDGVSGSKLADAVAVQKPEDSAIKTKLEPLRSELAQVYRLVAALKAGGARLEAGSAPDFYQVHITGLAAVYGQASNADLKTAQTDIQNAVDALTSALSAAYGNQALVEVVALSPVINKTASAEKVKYNAAADVAYVRVKRDDAVDPLDLERDRVRSQFNVAVPVGPDYAATFTIFFGLILVLALAILFIAVGLWSMDPGKDSIIYRMTTTRMKKD